nr:terminase small subunit [uncultured Pseudomonas sp.]
MALTKRKRDYAAARLRGMSQKESALAAGCPEKTAKQAGYNLERDLDVQAAMGRAVVVAEKKAASLPITPEPYIPPSSSDPLEFMRQMMEDERAEPKLRLDAATRLAQFTIPKPGAKGKKEEQVGAAKKAGTGRFGPAPPPLHVVK